MLLKRAWLALRQFWWVLAGIPLTIFVWKLARRSGPRAIEPDQLQAQLEALRRLSDLKDRSAAAAAEYRIKHDQATAKDELTQSRIRDALADPDRAAGRRRLIALERELFGDDP